MKPAKACAASTWLDGLPPTCGIPGQCAYFLDLDGTLVEIEHRPAAVEVTTALSALIQGLYAATSGAVALISGRSIIDLDRLFKCTYLPVAGQHGAERRDAFGQIHVATVDSVALAALRKQVHAWCARYPELHIEDKGLSVALHYGAAPELAKLLNRVVHDALDDLRADFLVQSGKMVVEIKPCGHDKGTAILAFLREPPFAGRLPVFIGDDVSDEHGFAAINALSGVSIKVGEGASCARWRLPSVAAVRRWLCEAAGNHDRYHANA